MADRLCKDGFLVKHLQYATEGTEVPEYFALWCGISLITSCLERKCFIKVRPPVYPNLYIVLVAGSAFAHKGTAIGQITDLIMNMKNPPRMLPQKVRAEKLISMLCTPAVVVTDKKSGTASSSKPQGLIISTEFGNLINQDAVKNGLVDFLTDAWDSLDFPFSYATISRGEETVREPCLSILGAITPAGLRRHVPAAVIGEGFTSRIIFVQSDKTKIDVGLPVLTPEQEKTRSFLLQDLEKIKGLSGEFTLNSKAQEFYLRRYSEVRNGPLAKTPALIGYAGRRGVILHKIAMAVSASFGDSLILTEQDYVQADQILINTEDRMAEVLQEVLSTESGADTGFVRNILKTERSMTRTNLLRKCSYRFSATELDLILDTLTKEGSVDMLVDGRTVRYVYCR